MLTYSGLVYEEFLPEVEKNLQRMAKKANRYGVFFNYEISPFPEKVKVFVFDHGRHIDYADFWTDGVQVTVRYDIVKANGWTPIAKIETIPNSDRRLVTTFTDAIKPKEEWFFSDMHCDHCNTVRFRNSVIICRHEDGREVQVGRSCLREYTGIDPAAIITKAEINDWFVHEDDDSYQFNFSSSHIYYETEKVIGVACDIVKKYGYVKSTESESTKLRLMEAILDHDEPSDEAKAKAELIRDWLLTKEIDDCESYDYNCLALVESGYSDLNHFGYLAYLPAAYDKAMESLRKWKEASEREQSTSQFIGEVGERIELHPTFAKVVTSWDTNFGTTFIWKILDDNGNVFTWKTANSVYAWSEQNKRILPNSMKGTVKAHTAYRGVPQTELTRCKCFY